MWLSEKLLEIPGNITVLSSLSPAIIFGKVLSLRRLANINHSIVLLNITVAVKIKTRALEFNI